MGGKGGWKRKSNDNQHNWTWGLDSKFEKLEN